MEQVVMGDFHRLTFSLRLALFNYVFLVGFISFMLLFVCCFCFCSFCVVHMLSTPGPDGRHYQSQIYSSKSSQSPDLSTGFYLSVYNNL